MQVGPYVLLGPIGAGGMGEVWKARDSRLNRVVAIKKIKGPLPPTPNWPLALGSELRRFNVV